MGFMGPRRRMGLSYWREAGGATTLIRRLISIPVSDSGAGHAFTQAALFQKILLQAAQLLVNEVVGLVNQANSCARLCRFPRAFGLWFRAAFSSQTARRKGRQW